MYIERTFVLDAPRHQAWAFLNEPEEIGRCLPGCHTVEVVEPGKYKAAVGIKVGPIKAGFEVLVDTNEERPPEYAAYTMRGADKDGGSKISAECTLTLADIEGKRTEITYTSKVHLVGKLGKFGGGVMQKFADGVNDQFIAAVTKRVSELYAVPETEPADDPAAPAEAVAAPQAGTGGAWSAVVGFVGRLLRGLRSMFGKPSGEVAK